MLLRESDIPPIVCDFSAMRQAGDTKRLFTLDASRSWAPGGELFDLLWEFGDGESMASSQERLGLVVTHVFPDDGTYQVELTASDSLGRMTRSVKTVRVGGLDVEMSDPMMSSRGIANSVHVSSGYVPVPDAQVTVELPDGGLRELKTDSNGAVVIESDWALYPIIEIDETQTFGSTVLLRASCSLGEKQVEVRAVHRDVQIEIQAYVNQCNEILGSVGDMDAFAGVAEDLMSAKQAMLNGVLPPRFQRQSDQLRGPADRARVDALAEWLDVTARYWRSIGTGRERGGTPGAT